MDAPKFTYDEVDIMLRGDGRNDYIGISAIDGQIAALVAGPAFVHPEEWLASMFGGKTPNPAGGSREHGVLKTILDRYNEVSATLAHYPDDYRPMFMNDDGKVHVRAWAVGFLRGLSHRADAWAKALQNGGSVRLLAPIFVYHDLAPELLRGMSDEERDLLKATGYNQIADNIVSIYTICQPYRLAEENAQPKRRRRRRK
jgi:yecA family protein